MILEPALWNKARQAGLKLAAVMSKLESMVQPGVTGLDLNEAAGQLMDSYGLKPSLVNYRGFKHNLCVSVDDVILHGVPTNIPFLSGDLVRLDLVANLDGLHVDSALTVCVGQTDPYKQMLLNVTRAALYVAIKRCKVGSKIKNITAGIDYTITNAGFVVCEEYGGHGIGQDCIHGEPFISNSMKIFSEEKLQLGQMIAIEPICTDAYGITVEMPNGIEYKPSCLSAHFEHTVLITDKGPEILTLRHGEKYEKA